MRARLELFYLEISTYIGVGVLGVLLTAVAFFSLPVLDFFGLQEPLLQLTGSRCGHVYTCV